MLTFKATFFWFIGSFVKYFLFCTSREMQFHSSKQFSTLLSFVQFCSMQPETKNRLIENLQEVRENSFGFQQEMMQ